MSERTKNSNAKTLRTLIGSKVLLIDGAMGTAIQKASGHDSSIDLSMFPETYNISHPKLIQDIHLDYLRSGADIITTNTFGANSFKFKLENYGSDSGSDCDGVIGSGGHSLEDVITAAVDNARVAMKNYAWEDKRQTFIAQDIGPLGKLTEPVGDLSFDLAYEKVKEQVIIGDKNGVDLFILETYTDIYELKAAMLAVKEHSNTPFIASVTFAEDGRMLLGTDPSTAVYILEDMGASAIGINCSLGPQQVLPYVKEMLLVSRQPIFVQPNAGMPRLVDGKTVFDVGPNEFALYAEQMLDFGISLIGGCCGTTPAHTGSLAGLIKSHPTVASGRTGSLLVDARPRAASILRGVELGRSVNIIGERINPTGKKSLKMAYIGKDFDYVADEAKKQEEAGAALIAINAGLPDVDEEETLISAISAVSEAITLPLVIDCKIPELMDRACRLYRGKAIINSVSGERESLDAMLPIAERYGCSLIALLLDDEGVPNSVEKRLEILDSIIVEAAGYGIGKERLIVDALALTVSAEQDAAIMTLRTIEEVTKRGLATTLGASNISFGLPDRILMNQTFLSMAVYAGLSSPITDPTVREYMDAIHAAEVLMGLDRDADAYIDYISRRGEVVRATQPRDVDRGEKLSEYSDKNGNKDKGEAGSANDLTDIIINGKRDKAREATLVLLEEKAPSQIIDTVIIPALEVVGERFEKNDIFLPQMVRSADTVKISFDTISEATPDGAGAKKYGKIVLATVKGDIHDIGKNIVGSMLSNYGFEVIDLGKDIDTNKVLDALEESGAKLLGLSALMTTTMKHMEETVRVVKVKYGKDIQIMVGGAVLTPEYAKKMGANFYSKDAMESVRIAQEVYIGK